MDILCAHRTATETAEFSYLVDKTWIYGSQIASLSALGPTNVARTRATAGGGYKQADSQPAGATAPPRLPRAGLYQHTSPLLPPPPFGCCCSIVDPLERGGRPIDPPCQISDAGRRPRSGFQPPADTTRTTPHMCCLRTLRAPPRRRGVLSSDDAPHPR